jgi:hypothetical protein
VRYKKRGVEVKERKGEWSGWGEVKKKKKELD